VDRKHRPAPRCGKRMASASSRPTPDRWLMARPCCSSCWSRLPFGRDGAICRSSRPFLTNPNAFLKTSPLRAKFIFDFGRHLPRRAVSTLRIGLITTVVSLLIGYSAGARMARMPSRAAGPCVVFDGGDRAMLKASSCALSPVMNHPQDKGVNKQTADPGGVISRRSRDDDVKESVRFRGGWVHTTCIHGVDPDRA